MVEWSVAALREVEEVDEIVVALPDGEPAPAGTVGTPGGASRSASVRAALGAAGAAEAGIVHDAPRPPATRAPLRRALAELDGCDAAIAATPVTDTIKRADDGRHVTETLDRPALWAVQTPQAFRRASLERALDVADDVLARATDDAWLVERVGGSVR